MPVKILLVILLCFGLGGFVNGQKLPNVQETSVRAPANTKIDGTAKEWNDSFQAFNNATFVYYSIANDDDNIYLIIKETDPLIINKILAGGITVSLSRKNKNVTNDGLRLTYPVYDHELPPSFRIVYNPAVFRNPKVNHDSLVTQSNLKFTQSSKEFKIFGAKNVADSLVSIYNDGGIKLAAQFDQNGAYIYELNIPLKYINNGDSKNSTFYYNIKLNEPSSLPLKNGRMPPPMPPMVVNNINIYETTDFSGIYKLTKKP